MKTLKPPKGLLSRKVTSLIVGLVALTSALSIAVMVMHEYDDSKREITWKVEQQIDARLASLENSLWLVNDDVTQALLRDLALNPHIESVRLLEAGNRRFVFGHYPEAVDLELSRKVVHEHRGRTMQLAELRVVVSFDLVWQQARENLGILLAIAVFQAIVLVVLLGTLLRRLIFRHLASITQHAHALASGEASNTSFGLLRKVHEQYDELDHLVLSLNSMSGQLLEKQSDLEVRVAARTHELAVINHELAQAEKIAEIGSWTCEVGGVCSHWSENTRRFLGFGALPTRPNWDDLLAGFVESDRARFHALVEQSRQDGSSIELSVKVRGMGGVHRRVDVIAQVDAAGVARGTLRDVSDDWERRRAMQLSEVIVESAAEGIVVADRQGQLVSANPAFARISGYSAVQLTNIQGRIFDSGLHPPGFYFRIVRAARRTGSWQGEVWLRRANGEALPTWVALSAVQGEEGFHNYVIVVSDMSELRAAEDELKVLAHHDALTGLPNRILLNERLDLAVRRMHRQNGKLAVLFMDLDRFKEVNDSLGHPVGDELLRQSATRLLQRVRETDTVARQGGDEFVIILEDIAHVDDAEVLARHLIEGFKRPFELAGHSVTIGSSIGIAVYPDDGQDATTLMRNADSAMYQAKEDGRNRAHVYAPHLTDSSIERLRLDNALRAALSAGELTVKYQPIWQTKARSVVGAEALIRWRRRREGEVPAEQIVASVERCGLEVELTDFVLGRVLDEMLSKPVDGEFYVSVNVPGSLLSSGEASRLFKRRLQGREHLSPHLVVEVTENALLRNPEVVTRCLEDLRDLGISVAIDDFGTGFASIGYLKSLPANILKIDRSFIRDIDRDHHDRVICRTIVRLGQSLKLRIVAEGVENEAQRSFLQATECDYSQGFLAAPALSVDEFFDHVHHAA